MAFAHHASGLSGSSDGLMDAFMIHMFFLPLFTESCH